MDEMMAEMNKSAGDLSAYQRDLANAQSQKSTVESDLSGAQNQLATAEKDKAAMMEKKRKFENDLGRDELYKNRSSGKIDSQQEKRSSGSLENTRWGGQLF